MSSLNSCLLPGNQFYHLCIFILCVDSLLNHRFFCKEAFLITVERMAANTKLGTPVVEIIHKALLRRNITHVFAYSGAVILPLLDRFDGSKITVIMNRNEQCCGHAAEGYAKASSKVGVTITTSGPGVTNLITPLQDAMKDYVPLLALTGQVATSDIGRGAFQECDAVALTSPCTKWSYQIQSENEIESCMEEALDLAISEPCGPVHLSIPADILTKYMSDDQKIKICSPSKAYGMNVNMEGNVRKVLHMIKFAKKPVIYAGQGTINCAPLLQQLAKTFDIPVATTLNAIGVFDETHPLALKMVGTYGAPAANYALQNADLVLAIGSRFADRATGPMSKYALEAKLSQKEKRGGFVHFDINPQEIGKVIDPDVALIGDCAMYMNALLDMNDAEHKSVGKPNSHQEQEGNIERNMWLTQIKKWKETFQLCRQYPSDGKLYAQRVVGEIDKQITNKSDFIFTTGCGCHQMIACLYIDWQYPRSIISSGSFGVMGVSTPFAIGAQLACPTKTVISIDGDGSFNMTSQDLSTIVEHKIPIKIALIDDGALTMVRHMQGLKTNITESKNPDYVKLGEAYGIHTIYCDRVRHVEKCVTDLLSFRGPVFGIFKTESQFSFPHVYPGKALDEMTFYQD